MFDPHRYAAEHHVMVRYRRGLPDLGRYYPSKSCILVRTGLTFIEERCVLAHELGHHAYGHNTTTPRNETLADQWAAGRLISIESVVQCALVWPENPEKWCHTLNVTPAILKAWLAQPRNYDRAHRIYRAATQGTHGPDHEIPDRARTPLRGALPEA